MQPQWRAQPTSEQLTPAITDPEEALARLREFFVRWAPVCVLSGAGLSAASGIGTYRDATGRWLRSAPIDARSFRQHTSARRRYWWRGAFGYPAFAAAQPNPGHHALAALERRGTLAGIVTQNVDGLHQRAGSARVVELHGNLSAVHCLDCGASFTRQEINARLQHLNAALFGRVGPSAQGARLADGDAELDEALAAQLQLPECDCCGGILMPAVVFFGGSIAPAVVRAADELLAGSRGLLVVGSSLGVYGGLRMVRRARDAQLPVLAINPGVSRGDGLFGERLAVPAAPLLAGLVQ